MKDEQLLRYSRHLLLNEIGVEGQEHILTARVLVIGAGGLGSPAALYLASAGIGNLTLADGDTVDLTNLQRHVTAKALDGLYLMIGEEEQRIRADPVKTTASVRFWSCICGRRNFTRLSLRIPTLKNIPRGVGLISGQWRRLS